MEHPGRLVEHLAWADERVIEALRAAEPAPPRALEFLAHVLAAEHVWYTRLTGSASELPVWPLLSLTDCAALATRNADALRAFVASLDSAALEREVRYTNSAGQAFSSTVHDILLHLAMHGTYHRGQIALTLREAGKVPAPTDYIAWVRGAPAATRTDRPPAQPA